MAAKSKMLVGLTAGLLAGSVGRASVIAHYSFDTNFNDSTGGHNATPSDGNVTISASSPKFGAGAANFAANTTGSDAVVSNPISFATNTAYTISFWANPASTADNSGGMIVGDASTPASFVWIEDTTGALRFRSTTSNQHDYTLPAAYKDGNWHNYVVESDGAGNVSLYFDNNLVASAAPGNTSLTINAIGQGYNSGSFSYKGGLDELWVTDSALTSAERTSLYTSNAVPEPASFLVIGAAAVLPLLRRRRLGSR